MHRRDKAIRYQLHATRRMRRRGITGEQVERVLRDPDGQRPAKRAGAVRFEKKLSARRRLCVIVEENDREMWVITAFST